MKLPKLIFSWKTANMQPRLALYEHHVNAEKTITVTFGNQRAGEVIPRSSDAHFYT